MENLLSKISPFARFTLKTNLTKDEVLLKFKEHVNLSRKYVQESGLEEHERYTGKISENGFVLKRHEPANRGIFPAYKVAVLTANDKTTQVSFKAFSISIMSTPIFVLLMVGLVGFLISTKHHVVASLPKMVFGGVVFCFMVSRFIKQQKSIFGAYYTELNEGRIFFKRLLEAEEL